MEAMHERIARHQLEIDRIQNKIHKLEAERKVWEDRIIVERRMLEEHIKQMGG